MVIGIHKRAVGVFSHRRDAENALYELRNSGFPIERVSIIKRDADSNDDIAGTQVKGVGNKSDEGATLGAVSGGVLGGLTGLLVGLGTLAIPGIGPIMLAGATATALATTLAGAGIGAATGGLLGGLIGLGIPEERAKVYNERVERGDYLVIIDGTDAEIAKAEEILRRQGIEEFDVFHQHGGVSGTTSHQAIATPPIPPVVPQKNFGSTKHAVGYFSHLHDAENAIGDLRTAGFPLSQISLFHRDSSQHKPFAGVSIGDRFDAMRLGLPDTRARFYNERINQGDYVLIVSGTDDEIHRAAAILDKHGIQQWEIYDPTVVSSTQPIASTAPLQKTKRAIGVFSNRQDAEAALMELRNAGFPMNQVSFIGKDTTSNKNIAGVNNLADGNKADTGAKAGAVTGGALGGLGGLLVGLGALAIPGVGPIIAGGAAATALTTAVAGGALGAAAGGLAGGLVGLGIPEDRARVYSDRINRGDYLVIVDGTEDEVHRAESILKRRGIEDFGIFDATDTKSVHHPDHNRDIHHKTLAVEPTSTNYSTGYSEDDPAVIIVDHRNETV